MLVFLSGDVTAASASRSVYPNFHCLIRSQAVGSSEPSTTLSGQGRGQISRRSFVVVVCLHLTNAFTLRSPTPKNISFVSGL